MKTFDEAFSEVTSDPILMRNLIDTRSYLDNEKWADLIITKSQSLFAKLAVAETSLQGLSASCATFHIIFALGVLCGQHMEREELPE